MSQVLMIKHVMTQAGHDNISISLALFEHSPLYGYVEVNGTDLDKLSCSDARRQFNNLMTRWHLRNYGTMPPAGHLVEVERKETRPMTDEKLFEYLAEVDAPLEVYEAVDRLIGAANPEAPPLYPEAATPAERAAAHLNALNGLLERGVGHLDSALGLTEEPIDLIQLGTYYLHLQHLRGIVTAMSRDIARLAKEGSDS